MGRLREETTDFIDRAPVVIAAARNIDAPPQTVFDVLADTPGWTEWFPGMSTARWTSLPPHGVGSTRHVRVGPLRVDEIFIAWDPPSAWGFTFTAANVPGLRAGVELAELVPLADGRTHVRYRMALDVSRALAALQPVLGPAVRRTLDQGLAALERHVRG